MKWLAVFIAFLSSVVHASVPLCPVALGSVGTLSCLTPNSAGISPFVAFFDCSATTDSTVANSVTQNVQFLWNFSDPSAISGKGNWLYGTHGAYSAKNIATGIVGAHMYRVTDGSGNQNYLAIVTAIDAAGNSATCGIAATAYDASGANGFPTTATTCIYNSAVGTGCPSGATQTASATILPIVAGHRYLYQCGGTFTGNTTSNNVTVIKYAVGAYGGCQDTQTNRPIFSNSGSGFIFQFTDTNQGQGSFSDISFAGNANNNGGAFWGNDRNTHAMYQVTFYNLYSNNETISYAFDTCSQCALIAVYMNEITGSVVQEIGTYVNTSGFSQYPLSGNAFNNINYTAILGSHFNGGTTNTANLAETVRIFGCVLCLIQSNDFMNAGPGYAQLKFMAGNTANPGPPPVGWNGYYTQYFGIEDNLITGTSGSSCVEVAPENTDDDERIRWGVFERNIVSCAPSSGGAFGMFVAGFYITIRDNAYYLTNANSAFGFVVCQRGNPGGSVPVPSNIEGYNNTIYSTVTFSNPGIVSTDAQGGDCTGNPTSTTIKNNICYLPNMGGQACVQTATGTTASNNTTTTTANPAWTNPSGTHLKMTDWKPTANYSGGTSVPVLNDALGIPWSPTWSLGAVHP